MVELALTVFQAQCCALTQLFSVGATALPATDGAGRRQEKADQGSPRGVYIHHLIESSTCPGAGAVITAQRDVSKSKLEEILLIPNLYS